MIESLVIIWVMSFDDWLFSCLLLNSNPGEIGFDSLLNFSHRFLPSFPHLPDGDDGKEFGKDHIEENEEGDTAGEYGPFHPGGKIEDRLTGKPGVGERGNDDHKSFQPHPDDDRDRCDQCPVGRPGFIKAEDGQGNDKTEEKHPPEEGSKFSGKFHPEDGHMDGLAPVKGGEIFREGEVEPEKGHHQKEDAQVVEMDGPEVIL